ncbi:MAG: M20/M25/M40 family metallo-hydrolase, partial [Hyphomicrobiaceae bacterium]
MSSYADAPVDAEAILADILALAAIESPTNHPPGVNAVLEAVAAHFDGTGARIERLAVAEGFGDALKVTCDPGANEPGILVLAHMDTVHPLGTLANELPIRREGDRVYGPGVYDMKGGLMIAVAAYLHRVIFSAL